MRQFRSRLALVSLVTVISAASAAAQGPFALLHSLFDPGTNAQSGANQGRSVAIDGTIAVVGAPYDDVGATDAGVVKVYHATTGALLHTLNNPTPARTDLFGSAVAISGSRVVIGAPYDTTGQIQAGSAYVYDLTSATPTMPVSTLINPSPAYYDLFGWSVAISGTRVVVGARWNDTGAGDAGSAYVYDLARATPTVPLLTLTNPSPAGSDSFGHSVAISGTRVVVGAYLDDTWAINAGSAYVFDLTSATPVVPVLTLTNPSPAASDVFGNSVAISGTWMVVGARYDNTKAANAGRAYVYDLTSATSFVPVATLTNSSLASSDNVAYAVAISGTRVIVGTHRNCPGALCAGNAYVYDLASASPAALVATLTNFSLPFPASSDQFAFSVAISGTLVLVGAPGNSTRAPGAGSAYVYDLARSVPTAPVVALNHPSPVLGDFFGLSVAISGTRVVVGAPYDDVGAIDAGSAYVYDWASATPTIPVATLANPSPVGTEYFGWSVAVSGTRVVIGAPLNYSRDGNTGSAYVYDWASTTPTVPVAILPNPSPEANDWFGGSVAIDHTRVVVGAYQDDTGALQAGSAYLYDLASTTPTTPVATLTNPNPTAHAIFGASVSIFGTKVVIGTPSDDSGAESAGSTYIYDFASPTPALPMLKLTNPNPTTSDLFGSSVAIHGTRVVIGAIYDDTGAFDAGSAYLYDLASATPTAPLITLTNPSPTRYFGFGRSVAVSGTRLVVVALRSGTVSPYSGTSFVYDLASGTLTSPVAALNNPSPVVDDVFGNSVAIDGATVVVGAPGDDTNASDRGAAYIFGPKPSLSIIRTARNAATLSWAPSGFLLQYADSFSPANWLNAPSGATNPVTIPATNASRFYRLFQP